jgi:hypothetical protein
MWSGFRRIVVVLTYIGTSGGRPPDLPDYDNTPGRNRTCDTRFRKPVLYPTELRGQLSLNLLKMIRDGKRRWQDRRRSCPTRLNARRDGNLTPKQVLVCHPVEDDPCPTRLRRQGVLTRNRMISGTGPRSRTACLQREGRSGQ